MPAPVVRQITINGSVVTGVGTASGTIAAGNDTRITGAAQTASNLSDLASATTARTNLGLGTAATASGAWIGRQVFTASGTYTPTAGTTAIDVTCVGGGGSGGGTALTGAGQAAGGAGGGAGGYVRKRFTTSFSGQAVTIGAAGAGAAAGVAGNAGGNTTFLTLTATGGGAGALGVATTVPGFTQGGGGGAATGGDINVPGQNATGAALYLSTIAQGGQGGNTPLGFAVQPKIVLTAIGGGGAAVGYGAGGSGGAATASQAAQTSGAGAPGVCQFDEFQ